MLRLRTVGALLMAALLTLAIGCSSGPRTPPNYALRGDACGAVPLDTFEHLSGGPPSTRTPTDLVQGLDGGSCEMEFDGSAGYLQLVTFIAIHPTGADAARSMYEKFRTNDAAHVRDGAVVSDVPDLGSAAYLERRQLSDGTAPDSSLYKFGVQDGNLVLTLIFSGYGRPGSDWPTSEQALQDELRSAVQQILATLAA